MKTHYQRLLIILTLFCNAFALQNVAWATEAPSNVNAEKPSIFDILHHEELLEVTIKTDLQKLIEDRWSEDFQPATFSYRDADGEEIAWRWRVKARGKSRRRICEFPPIKAKFKKDQLEARGLHREYNDWKLVTHCVDEKTIGTENLLREYLVYQLYREITPNSYRTQLVKITYEDTEGNLGKIKRYGFIIEDTDEMAAHVGGIEYEQLNTSLDSISDRAEITLSLFEYMIGNDDWNLAMLRNLKMVKPSEGYQMIPVPYDFDFSGLVNTSYAVPANELGLYHIRERLYQGADFDNEQMREVLGHFLDKKPALFAVVDNFDRLSREARNDIKNYLATFYDAIEPAYADEKTDLAAFFSLKNATVEKLLDLQQQVDYDGTSSSTSIPEGFRRQR